ncbi:hypothetical protein DFP73DRAFT_542512 [Morchella snyderi]|nr:hypothetical protein DFP73DRAFT_542512 [Morchella snyderi]
MPFPLREVWPAWRICHIAALLRPDAIASAATITCTMEQRRLAVPVTDFVDDKAAGTCAGTTVVTGFELRLAGAGCVFLAGEEVGGEGEGEGEEEGEEKGADMHGCGEVYGILE